MVERRHVLFATMKWDLGQYVDKQPHCSGSLKWLRLQRWKLTVTYSSNAAFHESFPTVFRATVRWVGGKGCERAMTEDSSLHVNLKPAVLECSCGVFWLHALNCILFYIFFLATRKKCKRQCNLQRASTAKTDYWGVLSISQVPGGSLRPCIASEFWSSPKRFTEWIANLDGRPFSPTIGLQLPSIR